MDSETGVPALTLTDLLSAWRRGWRILALGVLTGIALASAAHLLWPDSFEAVTVVQIESAEPDLVDMAAEEAVATSRRVTTEALDAMGNDSVSIENLESHSAAHAVRSSRVLRVTFSADAPQTAARGADALAQAYLAARAVDAAAKDATPARPTGRVVDPARIPTSPSGPGLAVTLLAGALVGLGVAAPLAAQSARVMKSQAVRAS